MKSQSSIGADEEGLAKKKGVSSCRSNTCGTSFV
jgi:hypothetical protein